jgi:NADH:ubiquinone oxidoreductase subunit 5 (subunit L)/multisubunit Na+/H+ antiporter MnhA subunit
MNQLSIVLQQALSLFTVIPLIAFLASLVWKNKQERPIARIVQFAKAFYVIAALVYAILWIVSGYTPVNHKFLTLYQSDHFVFAIQFYYDKITAVYSIVGSVLFFLVSTFSRYYMHRDEGYKRFFNTILFFALGYNFIIFSGNLETLFIGWEIIGISSFLLIAFYRGRYLPVKNAFKTISNYRLSDLALILAMWMMHHLTHQNINFGQLTEAKIIAGQPGNNNAAVFIMIMIVLAAMIKSAQFPFTSWLPRAMEGPTSSSAIFYGSLSVHIGVFLLLRTWPFWQNMLWIKILIIAIGVLTGIIATAIGRVQPTVKTQIAYSSAAQIGIIFIEVALGLHVLALVHFAGNAFLRTYQLLVSPSVLNYLVHHQYFHYYPPQEKPVSKIRAALYILGIKEWNLDTMMNKYLWAPFKWIGAQFKFLSSNGAVIMVTIIAVAAISLSLSKPAFLTGQQTILPALLLCASLALILFVFSFRGPAVTAWLYLLLAHIFIIAGVAINAHHINPIEIILYVSGIAAAFALGLYCLQKTKYIDNDVNLNSYHGYVYEQRQIALLFLLAAIGILGFPITAAFIGIDVLFTYVQSDQLLLITLLTLCFIFIELAAIRIFLRIYLGQHKKLDHPIAYRSS